MLHDVNLVKVKTLNRRMAAQIEVATYDSPLGKQILKDLREDLTRPLAWAQGEMVDGIPDMGKAWLMSHEGNLCWLSAPYGGKVSDSSPEWMVDCCKNLPQVFIG